MKKRVFFGFALLLVMFSFNGVLALSTNLKENYQPGETIIIEISGNILEPLTKDNVEFLRGHVFVPFDYDVNKLGNKYYLWAIAQENPNNYTLRINNVVTTVNGKTEEIDYEKNFTVFGDLIDYNIKPGFISANDEFEIEMELNKDFDEQIAVSFPEQRNVVLHPGQNTLVFPIESLEGTQNILIKIGHYDVPSYIIGKEKNNEAVLLPKVRFKPRYVESTAFSKETPTYPFEIINEGGAPVDLSFEYESDLFSIYPGNKSISSGETVEFNLTVKKTSSKINKTIYAKYGNSRIEMPVYLSFTENVTEVKTPYLEENFSETSQYSCSSLEGIICSANEICNSDTVSSVEGSCCLGICGVREDEKSYAWIGWLLAGIVLLIVLYVWARYKNVKRKDKFAESLK